MDLGLVTSGQSISNQTSDSTHPAAKNDTPTHAGRRRTLFSALKKTKGEVAVQSRAPADYPETWEDVMADDTVQRLALKLYPTAWLV